MSKAGAKTTDAIFLGVADYYEDSGAPYPDGPVDLFRLATRKPHIIFPAMLGASRWIVLMRRSFLESCDSRDWSIRVDDGTGSVLARLNLRSAGPSLPVSPGTADAPCPNTIFFGSGDYVLVHFHVEGVVPHPGVYDVYLVHDGEETRIGSAEFSYHKAPALTPDQVVAIGSNPDAVKAVQMALTCKACGQELRAYTALERSRKLESEGVVWYTELPSHFTCRCGKANLPLQYISESMHGLLLKDFSQSMSGLSYVRRYGHHEVAQTAKQFADVLDSDEGESVVQVFIEQHPILLARFGARRLFVKPNYLGKHFGDFAVLDTQGRLWLIELESPSMPLFKKNHHPRAELTHAYEQVKDWLDEYRKHPAAVLEGFKLPQSDVTDVHGVVIAGRRDSVTQAALQRHLSAPPYGPGIDFMTLDDLSTGMLELSRRLA